MVDTFRKQLDGCTYMPGGFNCTCAVNAMWLFRSTQGRINISACDVRRKTGDKSGGTHLGQMEKVNIALGVRGGRVYRPASTKLVLDLIKTGRYGSHWQGHYSVFKGTRYDCFRGNFGGNHDWYVSGLGTTINTLRVGDPGADGRAPGIPRSYQDIPIDLMVRAASKLDVSDPEEPYRALGTGKVYAYLTPPDPDLPVGHYAAVVTKPTALWNDDTKRWVYNGTNARAVGTKLEVRGKQFAKGGVACYPVTCGPFACNYPGYYVPVKNVRIGASI